MSIDERLRSGLALNTELPGPDVELALTATYGRVHRRRQARLGALALVAAAGVAAAAWLLVVPGTDQDAVPVEPSPTPTDLRGVVGALDPGSYALNAWGDSERDQRLPRVILTVPEGYWSNGGYVVDAGQDYVEPEEFGAVQVWRVDEVLTDPCRHGTAVEVGPTVADLANALVRQKGPSTRPRPVVLAGHHGLSLEVTVPAEQDLATCPDGDYPLWKARPDVFLAHSEPEVVHHLWILDVDGTRLVLVASLYPDQTDRVNEELLAIAESVRFDPPPDS